MADDPATLQARIERAVEMIEEYSASPDVLIEKELLNAAVTISNVYRCLRGWDD